jgi:Na+/phosphate symporter
METLGIIIAALGMCFFGVYRFREAFRQFPLEKLRQYTFLGFENPFASASLGVGVTAIMGDNFTVFLILGAWISSEVISLASSYLMGVWCNVGLLSLVYLNMLSPTPVIYFFVGFMCLLYKMQEFKQIRIYVDIVFGLSFILFGFQLIRGYIPILESLPLFQAAAAYLKGWWLFAFLFGFFVRMGLRSLFMVAVIGIIGIETSIFDLQQLVLFFAGSSLETTIFALKLASQFTGGFKQLAIVQIVFHLLSFGVACLIFLGLVIFKIDDPSSFWFLGSSPDLLVPNFAAVYLSISALLMTGIKGYVTRTIEQKWPLESNEDLSQLKFIQRQAVKAPEIALDMVRKEQKRLLHSILHYLEILRVEKNRLLGIVEDAHTAFFSLNADILAFIDKVSRRTTSQTLFQSFLNLSMQQKIIFSIENEFFRFATLFLSGVSHAETKLLYENFLESLDVSLMMMINMIETEYVDEVEIEALLSNKSAIVESLRKDFLLQANYLSKKEKQNILDMTLLFERIIWLMGDLMKSSIEHETYNAKEKEKKRRWMEELK